MPRKFKQAEWLASSVCTGAWERAAVAERLARALPADGPDPVALAASIRNRFYEDGPPNLKALTLFLIDHPLLQPVFQKGGIRGLLLDPPVMGRRQDNLAPLQLPELPTLRDVGLWLCLSDAEISWFADTRLRQGRVTEEKLHHYRYLWIPKRSGGIRLIETPKVRLKEIQRMIVSRILRHVPPHDSAHGFTRGRSIKTFAAPHLRQQVVLRLDLKDFFHSVPVARIAALFRRLGYPPNAARVLQGFCTNSVSPSLAGKPFTRLSWHDRKRLQGRHLPQGAPTSAQLANLCAWGLDCRLKGLADHYGYQYTRYADDLAFSGPSSLAGRARFIEALTGAIAQEEGFSLNHRKTRLRLASQRQRLAGVVVNERVNCSRADWDRLKATLHNCVKHGPESQNHDKHPDFKAHLKGRVTHAAWLNPSRGGKLQFLFNQIVW
ncbi:MAG: RNA-directed DNA polymerase [Alphaproteobacteria bacterium]|nr:MAG: RNA-directed DNA polymerase [Alphaproteobacteria bacterium]